MTDIVSTQVCKPQNLNISPGNSKNNLPDDAMVNERLKFAHTYGDRDLLLEIIFNKIINGKQEKLGNEIAFYFGIIILNKNVKFF